MNKSKKTIICIACLLYTSTKSFDEYVEKRAKGDVYYEVNPHDEEYFYAHEMRCRTVDYSAYKYLIKLKRKMRNI